MRFDAALGKTRGYGWKAGEWLMGVIGAVATFLGFFILFGSENEYVGLGGDWSWRVGDISTAWTYFLLIGGIVLLAGWLFLVIAGRSRTPLEATPRGDLVWHYSVFILVNAFVWAQDFALGTGLDYAYLMTIPWGIGLAIHTWVYFTREADTVAEPAEEKELEHH